MTKPTKWPLCPAKTRISLDVCPVWSIFAVHLKKAWVRLGRCPGWSESLLGTSHFVGFVMWRLKCQMLITLMNWALLNLLIIMKYPSYLRGARWLSGRVSDSGARGPGFETYLRRVVSLSKTLYSPKVLVNYPGSDGSVPTWLKNCWQGR